MSAYWSFRDRAAQRPDRRASRSTLVVVAPPALATVAFETAGVEVLGVSRAGKSSSCKTLCDLDSGDILREAAFEGKKPSRSSLPRQLLVSCSPWNLSSASRGTTGRGAARDQTGQNYGTLRERDGYG